MLCISALLIHPSYVPPLHAPLVQAWLLQAESLGALQQIPNPNVDELEKQLVRLEAELQSKREEVLQPYSPTTLIPRLDVHPLLLVQCPSGCPVLRPVLDWTSCPNLPR